MTLEEALPKFEAGDRSEEVLEAVATGARLWQGMKPEWGFSSPDYPDLVYTTRNAMLAETLQAGVDKMRKGTPVFFRYAPDWSQQA